MELGIPVTGGNVSFYNQTGSTPDPPDARRRRARRHRRRRQARPVGLAGRRPQHLPARHHEPRARRLRLGRHRARSPRRTSAGGRPRPREGARRAARRGDRRAAAHQRARPGGRRPRPGARRVRSCASASAPASCSTSSQERDGVDAATALFSESTGRVIVTVRREDDVRFQGLCDGRGFPVLRIGVTDAHVEALEVQGAFTVTRRRAARHARRDAAGPLRRRDRRGRHRGVRRPRAAGLRRCLLAAHRRLGRDADADRHPALRRARRPVRPRAGRHRAGRLGRRVAVRSPGRRRDHVPAVLLRGAAPLAVRARPARAPAAAAAERRVRARASRTCPGTRSWRTVAASTTTRPPSSPSAWR